MVKKLLIALAVFTLCAVILVTGFSKARKPAGIESGHNKIRVITTLFPLYDMARYIGSDKASVSLLLPPGVEAHSFEPRPSDILRISKADIFVYTGRFMEPWAADIIKGTINKELIIVDASKGLKLIPSVFHDADEPATSPDPHVWLDFDNAKIMVESIARALETRDPVNRNFYRQRTAQYSRRLTELDVAYRTTLSNCTSKEIVYGGHYAFGYTARRYGLKYHAAQGVSPDSEPTAHDLAKLVEQIKKGHISYVFYEELTSRKVSETIAHETNAKLLLLNAAHNLTRDQLQQGVTLFDIMETNLKNLKIGLGCK